MANKSKFENTTEAAMPSKAGIGWICFGSGFAELMTRPGGPSTMS